MSFLDGGSATRRGTYHTLVALLLQLIFATLIGGLKEAGSADPSVAVIQVSLLAVIQLLIALWAVCADPSDKLLGFTGFICSTCEMISSCLLLAANYSADDSDLATYYATMAVDFYKVAIFAPLVLGVNDTLIVPVVSAATTIVRRGRAENWPARKILFEVVLAVLRLPLDFIAEVIGQVLPWVSMLLFDVEKSETTESEVDLLAKAKGKAAVATTKAADRPERRRDEALRKGASRAGEFASDEKVVGPADQRAEAGVVEDDERTGFHGRHNH